VKKCSKEVAPQQKEPLYTVAGIVNKSCYYGNHITVPQEAKNRTTI
jgi:hypothetical protein